MTDAAAPPTATAQTAAYQAEFEAGVQQLLAGQYDAARTAFEALYQKTGSLRVKLEWARAAFLSKRYRLAQRLFDEVLEEDIPEAVRFNIGLYKTEVARRGGDLTDYGISFISSYNPFSVAKAKTIYLFGLPFAYVPPDPPKRLTGARAYLSYYRSLNDNETVRLLFDGEYTQYEGRSEDGPNSKAAIRTALQFKMRPEDDLSLRTGIDQYYERGNLLLWQPFVSLLWYKDEISGLLNQALIEARVGKNNYPDYSNLNGYNISVNGVFSKNINSSLQLGLSLYADHTHADLKSQSYRTGAAGIWAQAFIPQITSSVQLSYRWTHRAFQAPDELFLQHRTDRQHEISLTVRPYDLRFWSFYPALTVGYVKTDSTIPLYAYRGDYVNLSLRKNF